jgi:hypothetical protein
VKFVTFNILSLHRILYFQDLDILVNTLSSIVWPQEVVEVAKVLQEKKSSSGFWKAKLIFIREKKKTQSTPPKLLKSKMVKKPKCSFRHFEITMCLWIIFFNYEK